MSPGQFDEEESESYELWSLDRKQVKLIKKVLEPKDYVQESRHHDFRILHCSFVLSVYQNLEISFFLMDLLNLKIYFLMALDHFQTFRN